MRSRINYRLVTWVLLVCVPPACSTTGSGLTVRDKYASNSAVISTANGLPPATTPKSLLLGPGDQVDVFVWGYEDFSKRLTVNFNGMLPYSYTGELKVQGKTVAQVEQELRVALQGYIKNPLVRVTVATVRPIRSHVLGEVRKPGVIALASNESTVLEALAQAGGPNDDAQQRVLLVREDADKVYIHSIDYRTLTRDGDLRNNVVLNEGDVLFVPRSGSADVAREARRITDILTPLLLFQQATILWDSFQRALLHGNPSQQQTNNTVIITTN